ncbi:M20/M25/M40 family metallo-hydrolase [Leptolyngbya sp. 15MV]|nr:M20/M25/M40 family metallo-hydrolase [Leptolyngbya sp. 15MV]
MHTNIPLSGARLWDSLQEFARIGATPKGGCNRQTLTALDGQARALLRRQAEALGATLTLDRLGNMMFVRPGRDAARRPVAIGSHLDTQPTGGKFDGVLGVLAGLEILRALHEAGVETQAPIALINWTNEEGARFAPPMMGSGAAMGLFAEGEVLAKQDSAGAVFGDELSAIGWATSAVPTATAARSSSTVTETSRRSLPARLLSNMRCSVPSWKRKNTAAASSRATGGRSCPL